MGSIVCSELGTGRESALNVREGGREVHLESAGIIIKNTKHSLSKHV